MSTLHHFFTKIYQFSAYACYNLPKATLAKNAKKVTEKQRCETAGKGFLYTQGNNQKTPGCAKCHCCKPTGII